MAANKRIASETIYADADGNVVPENHPKAAIQVVAKGGHITDKIARRFNLDDEGKQKAKADKKKADKSEPTADEIEKDKHPKTLKSSGKSK